MKKIISFRCSVILNYWFNFACGGGPKDIVLITDKGDITDKSFNQGAYEGVKAYAKENKISYGYIKPTEAATEQYISAIEQAIADGAKVVVTPRLLIQAPINAVQKRSSRC